MKDRINNIAIRLALHFTDKSDLPKRFIKPKDKLFVDKRRDNVAEALFKSSVAKWEHFIKTLINYDNSEQVWRFINIAPVIETGISQVSLCLDFINFTDLFIRMRNDRNSEDEHIGIISMLYTEFQHEIERKLEIRS